VTFTGTVWPLVAGGAPSGYVRYRADTIIGNFTMPSNLPITSPTNISLDVLISDMGGLLNDGDPSTVVDFENGGWTGYEDASGVEGDSGGTDNSFRLTVNPPPAPPPPPPSGGGGGGAVTAPGLGILFGLLLLLRLPRRRAHA
jgi:hypothetical protein